MVYAIAYSQLKGGWSGKKATKLEGQLRLGIQKEIERKRLSKRKGEMPWILHGGKYVHD
jgi:hypothetical protein